MSADTSHTHERAHPWKDLKGAYTCPMSGHTPWKDIKREKAEGVGDEVYRLALPLLVERLGGVVEITEAEHDAFAERHGGIRNVAVQIQRTPTVGLRLTIIHKERPPLD